MEAFNMAEGKVRGHVDAICIHISLDGYKGSLKEVPLHFRFFQYFFKKSLKSLISYKLKAIKGQPFDLILIKSSFRFFYRSFKNFFWKISVHSFDFKFLNVST